MKLRKTTIITILLIPAVLPSGLFAETIDDFSLDPLPEFSSLTENADSDISTEKGNLFLAEEEYGEDSIEAARIRVRLATAYLEKGDSDSLHKGETHIKKAIELLSESLEATDEETFAAKLKEAEILSTAGKYVSAEAVLYELLEQHTGDADVHSQFGTLYDMQEKTAEAEEHFVKAGKAAIERYNLLKDSDQLDEIAIEKLSGHISRVAAFYEEQFRPDEAAEWYRENMRIVLPSLGPASSNANETFKKLKELIVEIMLISGEEEVGTAAYGVDNPTHLAFLYWGNGDGEKSEYLLKEKIALVMNSPEDNYQKKAKAITDLADFYAATSQTDKAADLYKKGLMMSQRGTSLTRHLITLTKAAYFHSATDNVYQSRQTIIDVIAHTELVDSGHFSLIPLYTLLSEHYVKNETDFQNAEIYLKKALTIAERCFGKSHMETAFVLEDLGKLYTNDQWKSSNTKDAMEAYKRALVIYDKTYGPINRESGEDFGLLSKLATVYRKLGYNDEASILEQRIELNKQASLDDIEFDRPFNPDASTVKSRFQLKTELKDNMFLVMRQQSINIDGTTDDSLATSAPIVSVSSETPVKPLTDSSSKGEPQDEEEDWEKQWEKEFETDFEKTLVGDDKDIDWDFDDDDFEDLDDW